VRCTGVSGRIACGFRTDLHFADGTVLLPKRGSLKQTVKQAHKHALKQAHKQALELSFNNQRALLHDLQP
jgi:hypothetical protein